jgi:hypothetical protein
VLGYLADITDDHIMEYYSKQVELSSNEPMTNFNIQNKETYQKLKMKSLSNEKLENGDDTLGSISKKEI